jgi:E3 ubiquitin-protein ligase RNF144
MCPDGETRPFAARHVFSRPFAQWRHTKSVHKMISPCLAHLDFTLAPHPSAFNDKRHPLEHQTTMDAETDKLTIQLQLIDIKDLLDSLSADEDREGDTRRSFELIESDLQRQLQVLEDRILTLKIMREEYGDYRNFSEPMEEEKPDTADHQLSTRLQDVTISDSDSEYSEELDTGSASDVSDCEEDEQWEMAKELYADAFDETMDRLPLEHDRTEEAAGAEVKASTSKQIDGSDALTKCCACMEVVRSKNVLTLRCKPEAHGYCRECLVDLFTSAIDNPTLFPPRCCKLPIPLDICRVLLPKELMKKFDLKVEELATPNPTYCSNAECSQFIRSQEIKAEVGTCVFCKEDTCVRCKCKNHEGLCPSDPHVQLLMDVAKRGKWQQCTKCNNMVELAHGCLHMTYVSQHPIDDVLLNNHCRCRCTHEFCYLCGAQWKRCACPLFGEELLTEPLPVPAAAPEAVARHLHHWRRLNDEHCRGCGADYLAFVMRCDGCNTTNCWRCINNRA